MPLRQRRYCPHCRALTDQWRDRPPRLPPALVLLELLVALAWLYVTPWICRECDAQRWPWPRR